MLVRSPERIQEQISSLRQLCWQAAGVERNGRQLTAALAEVRRRRSALEREPWLAAVHGEPCGRELELANGEGARLRPLHDLRQRLVLAELLIEAAAAREESRGGHFRTDAPAPQPHWQRHSVQRRGAGIRTAPVDLGSDRPAPVSRGPETGPLLTGAGLRG